MTRRVLAVLAVFKHRARSSQDKLEQIASSMVTEPSHSSGILCIESTSSFSCPGGGLTKEWFMKEWFRCGDDAPTRRFRRLKGERLWGV